MCGNGPVEGSSLSVVIAPTIIIIYFLIIQNIPQITLGSVADWQSLLRFLVVVGRRKGMMCSSINILLPISSRRKIFKYLSRAFTAEMKLKVPTS